MREFFSETLEVRVKISLAGIEEWKTNGSSKLSKFTFCFEVLVGEENIDYQDERQINFTSALWYIGSRGGPGNMDGIGITHEAET